MHAVLRPCFALLSAVLLLALSACAAPRMIDSDVQSFVSGAPPARPASYRFERLPSQNDALAQEQLEALATLALAKVELTPATLVSGVIAGTAAAAPSARYALQVSARIEPIASPYATPGDWWGRGHGRHGNGVGGQVGLMGGHIGWGGFGLSLEPSWVRHAVHILLRDSASGAPVYETSAVFDGPWSDSARLLPVVLDAALRDYPNPPSGPRKVVIELPGQQPADQ